MTVKTLTDAQKDAIVTIYNSKTKTIVDMAKHLGVSPRTVGRVLAERGLASPVPRLKGEAKAALDTLIAWGLNPRSLNELLQRLEDAGAFIMMEGCITGLNAHRITTPGVREYAVQLDDVAYNALLAEIIHLREARKHNSSVANAMLQLQNKADKNAD